VLNEAKLRAPGSSLGTSEAFESVREIFFWGGVTERDTTVVDSVPEYITGFAWSRVLSVYLVIRPANALLPLGT